VDWKLTPSHTVATYDEDRALRLGGSNGDEIMLHPIDHLPIAPIASREQDEAWLWQL
jgi:hypothetical protein